MSTIKVDTIATRTGSGNITASNTIVGNLTGNVTGNVTGNLTGNSTVGGTLGVTGNTTITSGNLVIATAGNGIDFSAATGSATGSSSALLDDYEEGTWTPTVGAGTINLSTYAGSAVYTKIGRLVIAFCRFHQFSDTSSSNGFVIGGLPFNVGQIEANVGHAWGNEIGNARAIYFYSGSGGATVAGYYGASNNGSYDHVTHSELGSNTNMIVRLMYFT